MSFQILPGVIDIHKLRMPKLGKILKKQLKKIPLSSGNMTEENLSKLWSEESYYLNRSQMFQQLSKDQKSRIMAIANRARLEEAFHIEKAGIYYGGKMVLLSKTFEERKLYGLFTADEAKHLEIIESYLPDVSTDYLENPFLGLLNNTIEKSSKNTLVFVIQVLLEGWGIKHYKFMKDTCVDPHLSESLQYIINDEVGHHGSGVLLFSEEKLSSVEMSEVNHIMDQFLSMVRIGPASILSAIQEVVGTMSKEEKICFLKEIDAIATTTENLNILKSMMEKASASKIINYCEEQNLFTPCSLEEMAVY